MNKEKERKDKLMNALIDLLIDRSYSDEILELVIDLINECGFTTEELVNDYMFDKATVDEALGLIKDENGKEV